jgi:hypothetical protein
VEWEHVQRVITDYGGKISHAARLLGIHRRSLQRNWRSSTGTLIWAVVDLPHVAGFSFFIRYVLLMDRHLAGDI